MEFKPELIEKLSKLEIFSDFDPADPKHAEILKQICEKLEIKTFSSGDIIIKEGDVGDSLHILYEGTVQVKRNTPNNDQFAIVNLSAEFNVFFGEVALIDSDTRSASIYAITDCKTLCIDEKNFKELCDKNHELGYHVMYRISKRLAASLRKSNKDLMTLYEALLDEVHGDN